MINQHSNELNKAYDSGYQDGTMDVWVWIRNHPNATRGDILAYIDNLKSEHPTGK